MNTHNEFIHAIAADIYADTPRLAFADWLDEQGEHKRAEFIRVQCELEPIRDQYEIPRAVELHEREDTLLREHQEEWFGKMPEGWDDWQTAGSLIFRRGFPDTLALPVRSFLQFGAELRTSFPTIRRIVLFRVNEYGERLADCAALEGVSELELACWYSMEDMEAIVRSEHLKHLKVLVYWLGPTEPDQSEIQCRLLGASNAWPELRELTLLNPYHEKEQAWKQLVTIVNTAAKRKIAVYRVGYPELFPFAPDFWYMFPGYLPDGRAAMGKEDFTTNPPTLCVITFDKEGKQTEEVIRVPAPEDLLAVPTKEWYDHKERLQQQLIHVLGFQPAFIRIQGCRFPDDEYGYNSPYPEEDEDFGEPDDDNDEESWEVRPTGNGGKTWWHIYEGDWVFGWDRYGDKSGGIVFT